MLEKTDIKWVIMTKDRKKIAKGTPRNRELIDIDNKNDKKRYLTYTSENTAKRGYTGVWFAGAHDYSEEDMEA